MSDLSDISIAARAVADPSTPPADLGAIAQMHPALRPQVALHPNTYPMLLDWLGAVGDPAVSAAVASRRSRGTSTVVDPQRPVCVPSRARRITASVLFILGGLFGAVKLDFQYPVCRMTWDWGTLPLGWSTGIYFMCDNSADMWSGSSVGGWESTIITLFYVIAPLVLITCGVLCLTVGRKNIIKAGTMIGSLLAAFTVVSIAFAVYGMAGEFRPSLEGRPVFLVDYLIFLAVPLIFVMVMRSRSVITLHSRKVLLIVSMVFGAGVFQILTFLADEIRQPEPELGDILLVPALLLLAFMVKDPAKLASGPPRQAM